MIKSKKHNGWNFGVSYTIGQKGKYLNIMFYKWTWMFSIGD